MTEETELLARYFAGLAADMRSRAGQRNAPPVPDREKVRDYVVRAETWEAAAALARTMEKPTLGAPFKGEPS